MAGIVEEPAKALAIRYPFAAGQIDGIMDGLVYGVAAALGSPPLRTSSTDSAGEWESQ